MQVEIWSDIVCPWCAIGRARFSAALAMFDARDTVEVRWRSFELDPTAPSVVSGNFVEPGSTNDGSDLRPATYVDRLAAKYGTPRAQAQAMIDRMTAQGAAEGVTFRFDMAQPGNTFDAHRVLHLAEDRGVQGAVKARLLSACLAEGEPIGDRATLCRLAGEAGLDPDEAATVLDGDAYAAAVRADEAQASAYGITGVPFFVIDQRFGVSGAQPPAALLSALQEAARRRTTFATDAEGTAARRAGDADHAHGSACADDVCAVAQ